MNSPLRTAALSLLALAAGAPALCASRLQDSELSYVEVRRRFEPLYEAPTFDLAWSPDGSRALYLGAAAQGGEPTVRVFELAAGSSESLAPGSAGAAYERVAFSAADALLWVPASMTVDVLPPDGAPITSRPLAETPAFLVPAQRPRGAAIGAEFVLHNTGTEPVELAWIGGGGAPVPYATIAPAGSHRQNSYATHQWEVTRAGQSLGRFFVTDRIAAAVVTERGLLTAPAPPAESERARELSEEELAVRRSRPRVQPVKDDATRLELISRNADGTQLLQPLQRTGEPLYGDPQILPHPELVDGHTVVVRRQRPWRREVHYVESAPRDQLQPVLHAYDYRKPGDALAEIGLELVDLQAKTIRAVSPELFPTPYALNRFRWSADGSAFTFHYNERGHQVYRVLRLDPTTGEVSVLVEERSPTFIDYPQKIDLRWLDGRGQFLWMSERSGWNHLELRDASTGELVRPLTSGQFVVRGIERLDEAAGHVWIRVSGVRDDEDPYHVHLARVDLDTAEFTLLTDGDGTHRFEFPPDGGAFVDTYSRVDLAPVTELRDAHTGALLAELARGSTQALEQAGWRPPLRFSAPGRDGSTPIWGIVHLPTHYDPQRSYPVIESIYAGPHGAHVPKEFTVVRKQNELAEWGFIVVQIDGMGTNHRGKAFHDVASKNLADAGLPDRRAWIEALANEIGGLDLTRVGIYGGSAGGQNALGALLSHGDFYKVAVSDCGCHDNRVDKLWWNELWMGWPIGPHYEAQSNVTRAHQLTGKLLLIVGEMDENVDPASTMQVVDALIKADKDFDLLVMPGVGHGAAETAYGTRRRRDFFIRHLLSAEGP